MSEANAMVPLGELVTELAEDLQGIPEPRPLAQTLADWSQQARGAYADNTQRAWRADWRGYARYCTRTGHCAMPSAPSTVRAFVLDCTRAAKKAGDVAALFGYDHPRASGGRLQ